MARKYDEGLGFYGVMRASAFLYSTLGHKLLDLSILFPRVRLRIGNRLVISSEDVETEVKKGLLTFKLKDSDVVPQAIDSELVSIGGWRINAISTIDSQASSKMIAESWELLEEILPMDRLLIPFLYSNGAYYARFHYSGAQPHWVDLLRLGYWHKKCLDLKDGDFHFKQTEIKRQIRKPLRNTEKTLDADGRGFFHFMEELRGRISSCSSELCVASLAERCGYKVSFHKRHDFLFESLPCEVKSLYSHATIEAQTGENLKMTVGGQVLGDKVNPYEELFNFVFSKKSLNHIHEAYKQGGKVIYLDITHTFASLFLYLLSTTKGIDLSICKGLSNAIKLANTNKEKLAVVVASSISSYEHKTPAFAIPIPLELIQLIKSKGEKSNFNNETKP